MSSHILSRIANVLERQFEGHIDMADFEKFGAEHFRACFLSRALSALCVKNLCKADPQTAGSAVVDGFDDGGIDAIHFDINADTLYLIQSKWFENPNKPLDPDAVRKFVTGIRDLLQLRFERFNDKVRAKEATICAALYSERPIRIRVVVIHTSTLKTPAHVTREIEDFIAELNDPVALAKLDFFDQAGIYKLVTSESEPAKIKLQIGMKDWGSIEQPFLAYYGRVHTSEIRQWWSEHGHGLFTQNLRLYYPNSDVNDALRQTLSGDPEFFWYFNNGITVIADKVIKGAAGSPGRQIGLFTCEGASIVNGAQTVGTIGNPNASDSPIEDPDADAGSWVHVRVISLERAPPEFGRRITRAANLQNAVGNREFAAMDPRLCLVLAFGGVDRG